MSLDIYSIPIKRSGRTSYDQLFIIQIKRISNALFGKWSEAFIDINYPNEEHIYLLSHVYSFIILSIQASD